MGSFEPDSQVVMLHCALSHRLLKKGASARLKTNLKVALFLHLSESRVEPGLDEDLGVGFTQNRLADQLLPKELVTY